MRGGGKHDRPSRSLRLQILHICPIFGQRYLVIGICTEIGLGRIKTRKQQMDEPLVCKVLSKFKCLFCNLKFHKSGDIQNKMLILLGGPKCWGHVLNSEFCCQAGAKYSVRVNLSSCTLIGQNLIDLAGFLRDCWYTILPTQQLRRTFWLGRADEHCDIDC